MSHASESLCESKAFFFKLGLWNSQDKLVFARRFQKRNQIEGNTTVSHASESLCESKAYFDYYWHFWTLDGILEAFQKALIWLVGIRFEIGALLVWDSHASESRCESKAYYGYYWHFWTLDDIWEAFQKALIWLGVIRFEIRRRWNDIACLDKILKLVPGNTWESHWNHLENTRETPWKHLGNTCFSRNFFILKY